MPVVCSAVTPVTTLLDRLVYETCVKSAKTALVATGALAAAHRATVTVEVASDVKLCTPLAKSSTNCENLLKTAILSSPF